MKILIIDDEPLICAIMQTYLKKLGDAKTSPSAVDALPLIKEFQPDIIISDYHMPEMTGLDLIKQLRKENNMTPVILISGSHISEVEQQMFADFLKKPITPADIVNKVNKMLNK